MELKNLKDLKELIKLIGPDAVKLAAPLIATLIVGSGRLGKIKDKDKLTAGLVLVIKGAVDVLENLDVE